MQLQQLKNLLTGVGDKRVSGHDRPLPGNGDAGAVELAEVLLNMVSGNLDPGFGVSDPGLGLDMVFPGRRLNNLRVALEE